MSKLKRPIKMAVDFCARKFLTKKTIEWNAKRYAKDIPF
jgi:hypothetical protein